MGGRLRNILWDIWKLRTLIIVIVTPLAVLPLPLVAKGSESKAAFVVIVMAVYWITEVIPISVTALIPVVLFPMMNIVKAKEVSKTYMNDTIMIFLGGLVVAVAIEVWNIHKRIALKVLLLVGTEPRWLMFGLMVSTWFLSMWISNTATTAMMIPIAEAILVQLKGTKKLADAAEDNNIELNDIAVEVKKEKESLNPIHGNAETAKNDNDKDNERNYPIEEVSEEEDDDGHYKRMCKALSLCICYAANSGGIASLTGTGPNLVLKGQADTLFGDRGLENPVTFATWMGFGLPLSALVLLVCWVWLQIYFLRCRGCYCCVAKDEGRKQMSKRVKAVIVKQYKALGPVTYGQGCAFTCFVILIILWITRDLGGVGGWGDLFEKDMVKDSTPSTLIAILLFVLPSTIPNVFGLNKKDGNERTPIRPLLQWRSVHEKMPWNLFLLLGGGYALAKGCEVSGLSLWIGQRLTVFKDLNPYLILLLLCYICAAATEVTSNTATATILMPILSNLAIATGVNPLFYMLPAALAVSFAFMLPVATPPNALVFSYGHVRVIDMISTGFLLNIVAVPILIMATATWGNAIFSFDVVPEAFRLNTTVANISYV